MASRNIATEFLYGIRLDTTGLDKQLKDAKKKIETTFENTTTTTGGVPSNGSGNGGNVVSQYYRRDYLGRFNAGADYQHEMISVVQEIADNVAVLAYSSGISEEDIVGFAKKRVSDFVPQETQEQLTEETKETVKGFAAFKKHLAGLASKFASAGALFGAWITLLKKTYDSTENLLNVMSEASNKFITGSSMFVDRATRSTMMRFGVGSTQAQAINIAQEKLGISTSEMATLTKGQREAFAQLMKVYQEGIDSIDTDKLESYNKNVQRYEMIRAEFDIKREVAITKLFANASGIDKLIDHFGEFLDSVIDILESPAAQTAMDVFIGFLDGVMSFITNAAKLVNKIPGFSSGNNVTNNTTTTNNYNVYSRGSFSSSPYATASEIQRVLL